MCHTTLVPGTTPQTRGLAPRLVAGPSLSSSDHVRGRSSLARLGGARRPDSYTWPGFVDALTTLVMVVIFVLVVFIFAQQFLLTAH